MDAVLKGRKAIGDVLTLFVSAISPAASTTFSLDLTHADGALGYIVWKARLHQHTATPTDILIGGSKVPREYPGHGA